MGLFDFRRRSLVRRARNAIKSLHALRVEEFMTDYVVTINPEKSVHDAAMLMIGEDISTLVVEKDESPIGILTERDFVLKVTNAAKSRVTDVMSDSLVTVRPASSVVEAVGLMKEHGIRKLVVTNDQNKIVGIVTQTDVCRMLHKRVRILTMAVPPLYVHDVMSKEIQSTPPDTNLSKVKELMKQHHISALPVIENDQYIGIFTEYDMVMNVYGSGATDPKTVRDLMKSPLKGIPADITIFDANLIMLFENVRRLIAVHDGNIVGVVTQTDIVHAAFQYLERTLEYLDSHEKTVSENTFEVLKDSTHIVSEYAGEHLRLYTVKER